VRWVQREERATCKCTDASCSGSDCEGTGTGRRV
jgi:hypothetical protein